MCLRYKVVLNGQSHVHATWDTRQRIENILAGEYHVSVLAENDEGQSEVWPQEEEEGGEELVYRIGELRPPRPEDITIAVFLDEDESVVAEVSWEEDERLLETGGYMVYVSTPAQVSLGARASDEPSRSFTVPLQGLLWALWNFEKVRCWL